MQISANKNHNNNNNIFLSDFFYLLFVGVEGYCCTWSHLMTQTHWVGCPWTRDRPVTETTTWQHTTFSRDKHPCPRRDSNPQSQQANGRRHTPQTARPPGSAIIIIIIIRDYCSITCTIYCSYRTAATLYTLDT